MQRKLKKLQIRKETLRKLEETQLTGVAAGYIYTTFSKCDPCDSLDCSTQCTQTCDCTLSCAC
jgi:hypothetical protein